MKILVVGLGYVGLSNAIFLAKKNTVIGFDIDLKKNDIINKKKYLDFDNNINLYISKDDLKLSTTTDISLVASTVDLVIVATPTNYDESSNFFETISVEETIREIVLLNKKALIVIKSTVPVGFTDKISTKLSTKQIIFSPEFLREDKALFDIFNPSRVIVGEKSERASSFAKLMSESILNKNVEILLTNSKEAEAIKLFANSYLAMRVSFFNELDSYALKKNLNTKEIIEGICLDPRIGNHYNNPSFGYGGYCLPKDTKQLLANYDNVPQNLIKAVVSANSTRKDFISSHIISMPFKTIGVYRLVMKSNSDNYRDSSIIGVIKKLLKHKIEIIIYEPMICGDDFLGSVVMKDLTEFKKKSELIITNRVNDEILDVSKKIFTRDIFGNN